MLYDVRIPAVSQTKQSASYFTLYGKTALEPITCAMKLLVSETLMVTVPHIARHGPPL